MTSFMFSPGCPCCESACVVDITLRLTDILTGEPIPGATVTASVDYSNTSFGVSGTTDAAGTYHLAKNLNVQTPMYGRLYVTLPDPYIAAQAPMILGQVGFPAEYPLSHRPIVEIIPLCGHPMTINLAAYKIRTNQLNLSWSYVNSSGVVTTINRVMYRDPSYPDPNTFYAACPNVNLGIFGGEGTATSSTPPYNTYEGIHDYNCNINMRNFPNDQHKQVFGPPTIMSDVYAPALFTFTNTHVGTNPTNPMITTVYPDKPGVVYSINPFVMEWTTTDPILLNPSPCPPSGTATDPSRNLSNTDYHVRISE